MTLTKCHSRVKARPKKLGQSTCHRMSWTKQGHIINKARTQKMERDSQRKSYPQSPVQRTQVGHRGLAQDWTWMKCHFRMKARPKIMGQGTCHRMVLTKHGHRGSTGRTQTMLDLQVKAAP